MQNPKHNLEEKLDTWCWLCLIFESFLMRMFRITHCTTPSWWFGGSECRHWFMPHRNPHKLMLMLFVLFVTLTDTARVDWYDQISSNKIGLRRCQSCKSQKTLLIRHRVFFVSLRLRPKWIVLATRVFVWVNWKLHRSPQGYKCFFPLQ